MTRLEELQSKKQMSNAEMNEMSALLGPGGVKTLGNVFDLGITNMAACFDNIEEGGKIAKEAFEKGFYIETISLRLQLCEFFLRMYIVGKTKSGKVITNGDKRTFGNFINECAQKGFDAELIEELKVFNEMRVSAIHKFLLGDIKYQDLKDACIATKDLPRKIEKYVANEIGIPMILS